MRKSILATLLATIAIASCKKDNDPSVTPPIVEGLYGGTVSVNNSGDTGDVLLRVFPGNELKITTFINAAATETGNWKLEGTSFKSIFSDGSGSILKLDATWDPGAGTLTGIFADSGNKPVATTKLTKKEALPVEGTYKGLLGKGSEKPTKDFGFTVKPSGAIADDHGATGTWTLIDNKFTASLGAIRDLDPYTINGLYNPTTGTIRGNWLADTVEGLFKVSKAK